MLYEVEVIRNASRNATIKVNASSKEEAEILAIELAGGVDFSSENEAFYEVECVRQMETVSQVELGNVILKKTNEKSSESKNMFEIACAVPNMCVLVSPTGESIDIRIKDGHLHIMINSDTEKTPVSYTEEWYRNQYQKDPKEKIYYHRISLPSSNRNNK
jgi:hypothetical protein